MQKMTNLSTECLIQLTKLGYDATPFNQILKQNAKREMRLRLGKVTVDDVLAAHPVTTNLLKFMRASIKMIGVSNLQSFIASMTQKLTLSDISDESKNYLDKAFIFSSRRRHTRCLSDWSSDVCSSDLVIARFDRDGIAAAHGKEGFVHGVVGIGARAALAVAVAARIASECAIDVHGRGNVCVRSEERRVGKGSWSGWGE